MSCLPSADGAFRDAAVTALAGIGPKLPEDQVAAALTALLRQKYPDVEVHRQEPLARLFDDDVWYAFRDGKPATAS